MSKSECLKFKLPLLRKSCLLFIFSPQKDQGDCVGDFQNLLFRSFKGNPSNKYMEFKRMKSIVSEHL